VSHNVFGSCGSTAISLIHAARGDVSGVALHAPPAKSRRQMAPPVEPTKNRSAFGIVIADASCPAPKPRPPTAVQDVPLLRDTNALSPARATVLPNTSSGG